MAQSLKYRNIFAAFKNVQYRNVFKRHHMRRNNATFYRFSRYTNFHKFYPILLALPLPMMQSNNEGEHEGKQDEHYYPPPEPVQLPDSKSSYSMNTLLVIGSLLSLSIGFIGYIIHNKIKSKLTVEDKKLLELISRKNKMGEMLVLGKSGVGKSYLIDSLIGKDLAIENDSNTGTFDVKSFDLEIKIQNYKIGTLKIWDSIGFFSEFSEEQCVKQLYKAKDCGIIMLVINGNSERLYDDLERLYHILNKLYNGDVWVNKSVIVITRGNQRINMKSKDKLIQRQNEWNKSIPKKLEKAGMSKENANNIPIVWAFGKNDNNWKTGLISTAIQRAQNDDKNVLAMINPYNVNDELIDELDDETQTIMKNKQKFGETLGYSKFLFSREEVSNWSKMYTL